MAAAELEKDMQSQSTPLAMGNVRRVLGSMFERLSKNTNISDDSGEKAFAAWAKKYTAVSDIPEWCVLA